MSVGLVQQKEVQQKEAVGGEEMAMVEGLGYSPSTRDRAIYQAICVERRGAGEVGGQWGLAATTARNIAHDTQRKLARRQHELDERSSLETLAHYFDAFQSQLNLLYMAWEASLGDAETLQRSTTKIGSPAGMDSEVVLRTERVIEKETVTARKQRPDARLMLLANSILRDLRAIEAEYHTQRAADARQRPLPGVPHGCLPVANEPGTLASEAGPPTVPPASHGQQRQARDDAELKAIIAALPQLAPGETREVSRVNSGPWQVKIRPPRAKPMSRRERHRREQELASASRASPPQSVSAPSQVSGSQRLAPSHLSPTPPGSASCRT